MTAKIYPYHPMSIDYAEECDLVACIRKADLAPLDTLTPIVRPFAEALYARNIDTPCAWCSEIVVYDPETAPAKPPKVCLPCLIERGEATEQ